MFSSLGLALIAASLQGAALKPAPIQVLVLGTFHMAGGRDAFNPNVKDIAEPRRQKEVEELVDRLAKFKPTKIAVESVYGSDKVQKQLDGYLAGTYALSRNEIDQVGYRLAKQCGLHEVVGIDWRKDMDIEGLLKHAGEIGQGDVAKALMDRFANEIVPKLGGDWMERQTLTQIYRMMNTPETDKLSHSLYIDMLTIGKDQDYMGADVVAGWYERNLKIAANVARIAKPGDRVFLLIGAGHCKLLREYLGEMRGFKVVNPATYLN